MRLTRRKPVTTPELAAEGARLVARFRDPFDQARIALAWAHDTFGDVDRPVSGRRTPVAGAPARRPIPCWLSTTCRRQGLRGDYAHDRDVFNRGGMWLTAGGWGGPRPGESWRAGGSATARSAT